MLIDELYTIEKFDYQDMVINASVDLNAEHPVFKGHFPGNPIMPGVCTIQLVKELTEQAIGKSLFLTLASNIKFMAIINPEKNNIIELEVQVNEADNQVKIKNTVSYDNTIALKMSAIFNIIE